MKNTKISILGTQYNILGHTEKEDEKLKELGGYCDYTTKTIVYKKITPEDLTGLEDLTFVYKRVLRHEIIHAFMYESGLWCNSFGVSCWAENEEMTDWFAIQSPKIYKVFEELNIQN